VASLPTTYVGYDTASLTLQDGTTSQFSMDLTKTHPGTAALAGTVTSGTLAPSHNDAYVSLPKGAFIKIASEDRDPSKMAFSYNVPTGVPGATLAVCAQAGSSLTWPFSLAHKHGLSPGQTGVALAVPDAASLGAPGSGAVLSTSTDFSWSAPSGQQGPAFYIVALELGDTRPFTQVRIVTSKTMVRMPKFPVALGPIVVPSVGGEWYVGQPLSASKSKTSKAEPAAPVEYRPVRKRLPKKRPSQTVSFTVGGAEGYLHAGSYPDDGLGEIFVKLGKQGSTLAGVMDAFSMSISVGLQYGIPLEFYVSKFMNLRFEPAGMTDDPDVRIATSVLDYLFRRLALDYLPYDKRAQIGVFTADERSAQVADAYGAPVDVDLEGLRTGVDASADPHPALSTSKPATPDVRKAGSSTELIELQLGKAADAPLCLTCGTKMRPAGSCYVCEGCGSTSGCS